MAVRRAALVAAMALSSTLPAAAGAAAQDREPPLAADRADGRAILKPGQDINSLSGAELRKELAEFIREEAGDGETPALYFLRINRKHPGKVHKMYGYSDRETAGGPQAFCLRCADRLGTVIGEEDRIARGARIAKHGISLNPRDIAGSVSDAALEHAPRTGDGLFLAMFWSTPGDAVGYLVPLASSAYGRPE